ncbi:Pr6Pr family membrane protein [Actinoplanes sp. NPDC024001]|uniref:Pr6Pr family membrane protein n=1 Tax=Actinoplanes sp. NPDC024001 TaxID=3154598 RepID=UPI0033FA4133
MTSSGGRSSRAWHGLIAIVVLAALITQITLILTGGADANSGRTDSATGTGVRLFRLFSYFTIQSNLLVLATAALLALDPWRDSRRWRVARLDALLGIVITGAVFGTVLASQVHLTGLSWWLTVAFHYVSPWAYLLGWLIFGPRPRITWGTVAAAFVWPAAWITYTFVHGALTDWYPYPFLTVTEIGYPAALRNTGLVLVVAAALAALFKMLDARLPARAARPEPATRTPAP